MDAIYNVLDVKSSFFIAFFPFNCVIISTNNKIRYENPASTGSVAGSKRFFSTFHLSSTHTNQRTCCEPAASISTCRDWRSKFATRSSSKKIRKRVKSVSKACRKPARTCRKSGCKPGRKPGLQLARIMECGHMAAQHNQSIAEGIALLFYIMLKTSYLK